MGFWGWGAAGSGFFAEFFAFFEAADAVGVDGADFGYFDADDVGSFSAGFDVPDGAGEFEGFGEGLDVDAHEDALAGFDAWSHAWGRAHHEGDAASAHVGDGVAVTAEVASAPARRRVRGRRGPAGSSN